MRYFPIFIDLQAATVVVVGGGEEALRKIRLLRKTPARIIVIADALHQELRGFTDVQWIALPYDASMLAGARLVYVADEALAERVSTDAQRLHIAVNVIDGAQHSTFLTPSIIDRDPVVIAVGTEGTAPVLGQALRSRIDSLLPADLGYLARRAAALRSTVAARLPQGHARRNFWQRFFHGPVRDALFNQDDRAFGLAVQSLLNSPAQQLAGHLSYISDEGGCGDLLTLRAQRRLMEADMIVFDQSSSRDILEMARRDAKRLALVGHQPDEIARLLCRSRAAGLQVVRLYHCEPRVEMNILQTDGVDFEALPSLQATTDDTDKVFSPFPTNSILSDEIMRAAS